LRVVVSLRSDVDLVFLCAMQLPYPLLEQSLRQLWTSNADAVSLLYAGTNALKVRTTNTNKQDRILSLQP
jgi:hypothetical protein